MPHLGDHPKRSLAALASRMAATFRSAFRRRTSKYDQYYVGPTRSARTKLHDNQGAIARNVLFGWSLSRGEPYSFSDLSFSSVGLGCDLLLPIPAGSADGLFSSRCFTPPPLWSSAKWGEARALFFRSVRICASRLGNSTGCECVMGQLCHRRVSRLTSPEGISQTRRLPRGT
jgi:hypothetical protein